MKLKAIILLILFSFCFGSGVGYVLAGAFFKPAERIVIKEVETPVTKYIKVIEYDNTAAIWECYKTPIAITYQMQSSTMHVRAQDGCKQTDQDIRLEAADRGGWKLYAGIAGAGLVAGAVIYGIIRK